jgi:hypothetical protein
MPNTTTPSPTNSVPHGEVERATELSRVGLHSAVLYN